MSVRVLKCNEDVIKPDQPVTEAGLGSMEGTQVGLISDFTPNKAFAQPHSSLTQSLSHTSLHSLDSSWPLIPCTYPTPTPLSPRCD